MKFPSSEEVLARIPEAPPLFAAAVLEAHDHISVMAGMPGLTARGVKTPFHDVFYEVIRRRFAALVQAGTWWLETRDQRCILGREEMLFVFNSTAEDGRRAGNNTGQCGTLGRQTFFGWTSGGSVGQSELVITVSTQLDLTLAEPPILCLVLECDDEVIWKHRIDLGEAGSQPASITPIKPQQPPTGVIVRLDTKKQAEKQNE